MCLLGTWGPSTKAFFFGQDTLDDALRRIMFRPLRNGAELVTCSDSLGRHLLLALPGLWPFAKAAIENAPWFDDSDRFDQRRLRLIDLDGSGTTDLVYLHRDGVRVAFNQSGNGWSALHALKLSPGVDDVVDIAALDLLGNGTCCLAWSRRSKARIDPCAT